MIETTPNDLTSRVLARLAEICGNDEVRTNLDLPIYARDIMDSMKTVEFIVALEEELGVYVSPADLDREMWATPRKIVADIERRQRL